MEDRTVICWDKDDIDALGILKVDVLALGMLTCIRKAVRAARRAPRHALHARDAAGRGPGGLRHALPRGHARGVPGGEPGADELPAAAAAALVLRSGHRGGDRAARADPGRHGASLPAAAARGGEGGVSLRRAGGGAGQDARGAAVPGAGDADRHHRRGLHARGGGPAAPRARDLQEDRHHPHLPRAVPRRHGGERLSGRLRRALLPPDRGLRLVRLSREPRGELRAARLRLGLAQVPPPGGLRLRAPELAADGLLRAGADRARRARARGGGAPGLHQRQRLGQHAGAGRQGRAGAAAGLPPDQGRSQGRRGLDRGGAGQRLPRRGRGLAAGRHAAAAARAAGRGGRLREPRADAGARRSGRSRAIGDGRAAAALRRGRGRGGGGGRWRCRR